jgi:TolC family type I secretion outer membrane protein
VNFGRKVSIALPAIALCLNTTPIVAKSTFKHNQLQKLLPALLNKDPRVKAAKEDVLAADWSITKVRAAWLPSLSYSGFAGSEEIRNPGTTANTTFGVHETKLDFNQLIYDFGKTGSAIDSAKQSYEKSIATYNGVVQDVTAEGVSAYLGIYKAYKTLSYARRYQDNVNKQVKMEQSRVKKGSGYSTDVLEAEAQLSGAQARLVQAQGGMTTAKNSFYRTFSHNPQSPSSFRLPKIPRDTMPGSLKEAQQTALKNNTSIRSAELSVDIARQAFLGAKATLTAPSLTASASAKLDHNVSATEGSKKTYDAKLNLSFPFFSGLGDYAAVKSAQHALSSAEMSLDNQRLVQREKVSNDWQAMITAKQNYSKLQKQVNQLSKFLKLATKERAMGRKTLLEVLVADTNYINAADASIGARVQYIKSRFTVLRDMNALSLINLNIHSGPTEFITKNEAIDLAKIRLAAQLAKAKRARKQARLAALKKKKLAQAAEKAKRNFTFKQKKLSKSQVKALTNQLKQFKVENDIKTVKSVKSKKPVNSAAKTTPVVAKKLTKQQVKAVTRQLNQFKKENDVQSVKSFKSLKSYMKTHSISKSTPPAKKDKKQSTASKGTSKETTKKSQAKKTTLPAKHVTSITDQIKKFRKDNNV